MLTQNLGYPRIGDKRQLKKAEEKYWAGKVELETLEETAKQLRNQNWQMQKEAGLDLIPSNDFSMYDQVLDTILMTGAIPEQFETLKKEKKLSDIDLYFALARGYQKDGVDLKALEMTKWFDTNYHYIVPEFKADQQFSFFFDKVVREFQEAKEAGFDTKPVLLGPLSFLFLGKEKETGFNRLDLIDRLLPVYVQVLEKLKEKGAKYIQLDEPCLILNLSDEERALYQRVYAEIASQFPDLHLILAGYFGDYGHNLNMVLNLPVQTLHLDLVRGADQLEKVLKSNLKESNKNLSLGIIDGRNIWKNDFTQSLEVITKVKEAIGEDRTWIAPSCSLLHVPCDLDLENDEEALPAEVKNWLAFAKQKVKEVVTLADLASEKPSEGALQALESNKQAIESKRESQRIHDQSVKDRVNALKDKDGRRLSVFKERKQKQLVDLKLPAFPTTTIGSFPQTKEVRKWRFARKKGKISEEEYDRFIKKEIEESIRWQEDIGIDVPVHGEFERNDMVEYFGQQLEGFVFTKFGWVQSYGSRCVKPPIIVGDVSRKGAMTVYYTQYAQSLTDKPVKGMLTGPVTILQWSFVRNDQARSATCKQIALAIRDEVVDLEKAGIKIIQIDEPALREGLPLKKENWAGYLKWAVEAFRITSSGVKDETQIHTHMCYSEFNDIIEDIAKMDADVITIETSRSQMELLDAFANFNYPNDIGPGVYDIHSPRVPSKEEIVDLIHKAVKVVPKEQLWVNPDCGLKTRKWKETRAALENMMKATKELRA